MTEVRLGVVCQNHYPYLPLVFQYALTLQSKLPLPWIVHLSGREDSILPAGLVLDVELVSIAFDTQAELAAGKAEFGIGETPLLTDANGTVSAEYDVLKWAVRSGEPSHTFILVNTDGVIGFITNKNQLINIDCNRGWIDLLGFTKGELKASLHI